VSLRFCRYDVSVSYPFRGCFARSFEQCNLRSGRFSRRIVWKKPKVVRK
jgi:hypothetical protein